MSSMRGVLSSAVKNNSNGVEARTETKRLKPINKFVTHHIARSHSFISSFIAFATPKLAVAMAVRVVFVISV